MTNTADKQAVLARPETAPPTPPDDEPTIASEDLLRGAKSVIITHAGVRYRLLVTRNDKLLLQK